MKVRGQQIKVKKFLKYLNKKIDKYLGFLLVLHLSNIAFNEP